jgi:hypothetical protein
MKPPPTQHYLALCTKNLSYHSLETGQDMISLLKSCRHTNWTELSTGKLNQDWSSASVTLTLQCDRLYSIQLRYQHLYTYNIKLCHVKKISNQMYNFYLCNENQLDALFILSLFHQSTCTFFRLICSPSSGGILYISTIGTCCALWLSFGQKTVN